MGMTVDDVTRYRFTVELGADETDRARLLKALSSAVPLDCIPSLLQSSGFAVYEIALYEVEPNAE